MSNANDEPSTTEQQMKAIGQAASHAGETMAAAAASMQKFAAAFRKAMADEAIRRAAWRKANNCQTMRERLRDQGWDTSKGLP